MQENNEAVNYTDLKLGSPQKEPQIAPSNGADKTHKPLSASPQNESEQNLSFKLLLRTFFAIFVGFLVLLPMIYIKNEIYYSSRDISVLWNEYSILMEENRDLRQKIETIRFKHQILDTLEIE